MTACVEVVVPGPWWNTLTYAFDGSPVRGTRVRVPLGRGTRVGFLAEKTSSEFSHGKLRAVEEALDEAPLFGDDLWELFAWMGRTFLCGMGEALQVASPKALLQGEAFVPPPSLVRPGAFFAEELFFHPSDRTRFDYYREKLLTPERKALLLFPEAELARSFHARLPLSLRSESLLWPSVGGKKHWEAWKKARSGEVRIVIGAPGSVFAPLDFDLAIVDDESNPAYVFQRSPHVSARSLVGWRARKAGATLLLAGRMPSSKTFLRSRPKCEILPKRGDFVFVDLAKPLKNEVWGVEGSLPVTGALLDRTRETLERGRAVLWVMDRKGQAGEVACNDCGAAFSCPRCGTVMRSETGGARLRCVRCGYAKPLPDRCPACKGALFLGKRPGLEALHSWALHFLKGHSVRLDSGENYEKLSKDEPSLLLGTRKILSCCDRADVGLVAWLDLDAESRKIDYNARFQAFSMVWESYWRGTDIADPSKAGRRVLIQSRRSGEGWRNLFSMGWERFWYSELEERKNLELPPYGLLVQIDLPPDEERRGFVEALEKNGFFVMDSGERSAPLWISVRSTEALRVALAPRFEIRYSRAEFPVVTVCSE